MYQTLKETAEGPRLVDIEPRHDVSRQPVLPGQVVALLMGYSEVCTHMRIAGKMMLALIQDRSVQLLRLDDDRLWPVGGAITHGEAGIFELPATRALYYYPPLLELPK